MIWLLGGMALLFFLFSEGLQGNHAAMIILLVIVLFLLVIVI
ncbi:hypothetical protein [Aquibium microcysteis]|nr:hypothetical protein [Aquibium microcysteis]